MGELPRARWAIALAGLITVACGYRPSTTTPTGLHPVPQDVQQACTSFVTIAFSVDTITDHASGDARHRAAQSFGVPDLDEGAAGGGRDREWTLLQAHRAHVTVSTQPVADDPPPVRADQAAAGVRVSRTAVGVDGWTQILPAAVAFCALRHAQGGWKVAGLTLSVDGGTP